MFAIATPLLAFALAATGARNSNWIPGSETSSCDLTDVDFSDSRHGFATCAFGDAMTTEDGGRTWSVFHTDLAQSLLFAHASSADELYSARLGFYRSTDGGDSWEELGGLSANAGSSVFDVHFGKDGHLVAIQGGMLFTSDDDGVAWDLRFPETPDVYFDELHFPSETVGYASGGITTEQGSLGSVYRTDDGGVTWTRRPFTHGEVSAADFIDEQHGVVATNPGELWSTADGGATWALIGPAPDGSILLDLVHRDASHWYAVSYQGCLYETHDAGVEWETGYCDPNANALAAISIAGGAAVAGGNGGVVLYENRILTAGFE
jgi:photosystem II stability/assembly factor-like uncharacterized protein